MGVGQQHMDGRTEGDHPGLGSTSETPSVPWAPPPFPQAPLPLPAQDTQAFVSAFCFFLMQIRWKYNSISKIRPEAAASQHLRGTLPRAPASPTQGAPLHGLPAQGSWVTTGYPQGPPRLPPTLLPGVSGPLAVPRAHSRSSAAQGRGPPMSVFRGSPLLPGPITSTGSLPRPSLEFRSPPAPRPVPLPRLSLLLRTQSALLPWPACVSLWTASPQDSARSQRAPSTQLTTT